MARWNFLPRARMGRSVTKMIKDPNSITVYRLGNAALAASGCFLALYNVRRFIFGAPIESGFLLATITLAFVGLALVVVAKCLRNLEDKLRSASVKPRSNR